MSKVNPSKIMTEYEFSNSPYKNLMSYQEYFNQALKLGSAFTFQRAFLVQSTKDTAEDISESIQGWYIEKENKKVAAEMRYYAALEQYNTMEVSEAKALRDLNYATNIYGENSSKYNQALKNYNISTKTLFNANVELGCARDQFNFANGSAFKAYLASRNALS